MRSLAAAVLATFAVGCAGAVPATHFYRLDYQRAAPAMTTNTTAMPARLPTLAIDTLTAAQPYDDQKMVYRVDRYRLDYYEYHQWSAAPGALIADYLARACESSGRFATVVREPDSTADISITGRVLAIEEIDRTRAHWFGRVAFELTAIDPTTGRTIWSATYDETEPMPARSPEGLASAVTAAMRRIADRAIPAISRLANPRDHDSARHVACNCSGHGHASVRRTAGWIAPRVRRSVPVGPRRGVALRTPLDAR